MTDNKQQQQQYEDAANKIVSNPSVIALGTTFKEFKPGTMTTEFYAMVFSQILVAILTIKYAFLTPAGSILTILFLPLVSGFISMAYTFARTHVKIQFIQSILTRSGAMIGTEMAQVTTTTTKVGS